MTRPITCRSCRSFGREYCHGERMICHGYYPTLLMRCWMAFRVWCK